MKKFLRKAEVVLSKITTIGFVIAITTFSIGCAIWSIKWVLTLVGVM